MYSDCKSNPELSVLIVNALLTELFGRHPSQHNILSKQITQLEVHWQLKPKGSAGFLEFYDQEYLRYQNYFIDIF